jgi:arsenate reductase-like glutaredoxin family protein
MSIIQIFGRSKCFDTKKAERFFKERRISVQRIEVDKFGISRGELRSVCAAVGGIQELIDPQSKESVLIRYLAYDSDKEEKLLETPKALRTPIVRNGKQATVGYCPEIWEQWVKA